MNENRVYLSLLEWMHKGAVGVNEVNQGCDIKKYEKKIESQPGIGKFLIPLFSITNNAKSGRNHFNNNRQSAWLFSVHIQKHNLS